MNTYNDMRSGSRGTHRRRGRVLLSAVTLSSVVSLGLGGAVAGASTATVKANKLTAAQVSTLKTDVATAERPSRWLAPGPAFSAKSLKGKTLFLLDDGDLPFTETFAAGVLTAAKDAGLKATRGNGHSIITQDVQLLGNAVNAKVSVIVLLVNATAPLSSALKKAKAAGIPVIAGTTGDPSLPTAADKAIGVTAYDNYCFSCAGKLAAEFEILKRGGVMNTQIQQWPGTPPSDAVVKGWVGATKTFCPKTCTSSFVNNSFAGNYVQGIQNAAQVAAQNSQINSIFTAYDFQLALTLPALVAAHATSRIDLLSENADLAQMQELKSGSSVVADPGTPVAWLGWAAVDQALRALKKLPVAADERLPIRMFDTKNINSIDLTVDPAKWYGGATYGLDYLKLWGLK